MRKNVCLLICWCMAMAASAQDGGRRCFWAAAGQQSILLDSVFFDPSTFEISPDQEFTFDVANKVLLFQKVLKDSVRICFRVFPIQVGQKFSTRDKEEYFEDISAYKAQSGARKEEKAILPEETIFQTDNIEKMGAISRSVSFGNSQNVFVNSSLNLQLEGKITEDINLQAVITDQNIPFQPEGNTQQIRDFDNVFIRLYNDKFDFIAGDVVLQSQENHFLKYYKNVQGGHLTYKYGTEKSKASTSAAISVAKGQFASVLIDPIEGVQGPYRVRGPNNERFVIVMANSEKVFLDGRQLLRGFDRDYVIDYNLAEITFNPSVLVTKFSRIRVDYEYADQNYSRSIMALGHEQEWGRVRFRSQLYREKDNPNQPLAFTLSDADKLSLSAEGISARFGTISGADSLGFSPDRILYAKVDTVVSQARYEVFKFSTDASVAFFAVTFSEVGENNGNYRQITTSVNGRVFEWVAPVNGLPQGNYEPQISVPTPNLKQLWSNELQYKINDHHAFFTELALSNHTNNLYSREDANDNTGWASRTGYRMSALPIGAGGYRLDSELSYEYNNADFRAIDRFRYIEFDRDWSFTALDSIPALNENILVAQARLIKDQGNFVAYKFSGRQRETAFSGIQNQVQLAKRLGRIRHKTDFFQLNSTQGAAGSTWLRWAADTYYESKYIVPGYVYQVDRNRVFFTSNDSVFSTAMNFSEHQWYIKTNDTLKNQLRVDFAVRDDLLPVEGVLTPQNKAFTWSLKGLSRLGANQRLQYNFTYRKLRNLLDPSQDDELTTMGRLDWSGAFLDKILTTDLTYAISNSRELRREFIFIPVNNGLGTHTWRDDNGDGVQDLTEFYLAINPDERNYIKIFTPTDDYILAYNNVLNHRISIDMPRAWQKQGGVKAVLGRLSNVTSFALDSKTTSDDLSARYNPFSGNVDDADIISTRKNVRSTMFVNRGNPKYGMEVVYSALSGKMLLTNGIESKGQEAWNFNTRYNIQREVTLQLKYENGQRSNRSDVLENRNYLIAYHNIMPQLTWQPSTQFRALGQYAYRNKQNRFSEGMGEYSQISEYQAELRWSKAIERSILANVKLLEINFEGVENSPIGYELLEALRPGTNFTWSLQWQQKLLNGLQMSLGYEGRKSPAQQIVHIGRMQVTALF